MHKLLIILIATLLLPLSCYAESNKFPITITKVLDGDTVKAKIDNNEFSIRLVNIDCFETSRINRAYKQAYENNLSIENVIEKGNLAKEELSRQIDKHKMYMEFKGLDVYGRVLGVLYKDDFNLNNHMQNTDFCYAYFYKKH